MQEKRRRHGWKTAWSAAALALASLGAAGQTPGPRPGPGPGTDAPERPCVCFGAGAVCDFGWATGCVAVCPKGGCKCTGGGCFLGFPVHPQCECL